MGISFRPFGGLELPKFTPPVSHGDVQGPDREALANLTREIAGDRVWLESRGRVYLQSLPKLGGVGFTGAQLASFLEYFNGRNYRGRAGAQLLFQGPPGRRAYIYVYDPAGGSVRSSESEFDENGRLQLTFTSDGPGEVGVTVSLVPLPERLAAKPPALLNMIPVLSSLKLTFWHVMVRTGNMTDRWMRLQGRAVYRQPLPGVFWPPHRFGYTIGLAGYATWREIVPVISGRSFYYMVGVSAWCNTPEAYPPHAKCCEYRRNTWWKAEILARKRLGENWKIVGSDRINISFHITARLDVEGVSYLGRCVSRDVACGWEEGPSCSDVVS